MDYTGQSTHTTLPSLLSKLDVSQLQANRSATQRWVSLGRLTDILWRNKVDATATKATDSPTTALVLLVERSSSSSSSSDATGRPLSEAWSSFLWPQCEFATSKAQGTVNNYQASPTALEKMHATHSEFIYHDETVHQFTVGDLRAVLKVLFSACTSFWGACDLSTGCMWTPLQFEYEARLASLLETSPNLARFWHDASKREGRRLYRFGGCLRDIVSGLAQERGGDEYFSPGTKQGGDVDMYVHSPDYDTRLPLPNGSAGRGEFVEDERVRDNTYPFWDEDEDDIIPPPPPPPSPPCPFDMVSGNMISDGSNRSYIGAVDSLGPLPSKQGKDLFRIRFAHWEGVVFRYANALRPVDTAGYFSNTDDMPEWKVACDVFLRGQGTEDTYFDYELNMCDFDVNRLVENQGMLFLRSFVWTQCPYLDEEREHARLLPVLLQRRFGFAYRNNPVRANPPDSRLMRRILRMIVYKSFRLDTENADNVQCVGSLWLHLFLEVFARRESSETNTNLLAEYDWIRFFGLSAKQTAGACVAHLVRFWVPETGHALAEWLQSELAVPPPVGTCWTRTHPFEAFFALSWPFWLELAGVCLSPILWDTVMQLVLSRRSVTTSSISALLDTPPNSVLGGCACDLPESQNNKHADPYHVRDTCTVWAHSYFQWSSLNLVRRAEACQRDKEMDEKITKLKKQVEEEEAKAAAPGAAASRYYHHSDDDDEDNEGHLYGRRRTAQKATAKQRLARVLRMRDDYYDDNDAHRRYNWFEFKPVVPQLCFRSAVIRFLLSRDKVPNLAEWIQASELWKRLIESEASDVSVQLLLGLVLGEVALLEQQWKYVVVDNRGWLRREHVRELKRLIVSLEKQHSEERWQLMIDHDTRLRQAPKPATVDRRGRTLSSTSGAARRRDIELRKTLHQLHCQLAQETDDMHERHKSQRTELSDRMTAIQLGNAPLEDLTHLPLTLSREWFETLTASPRTSAALVRRALELYDETFGAGEFRAVHRMVLFEDAPTTTSWGSRNTLSLIETILVGAPRGQLVDILRVLAEVQCLDMCRVERNWARLYDFSSSSDDVLRGLLKPTTSPDVAIVQALLQLPSPSVRLRVGVLLQLCRRAPSFVGVYAREAFGGKPIAKDPTQWNAMEYDVKAVVATGLTHPRFLPPPDSFVSHVSDYNNAALMLLNNNPIHFVQLAPLCGDDLDRLHEWLQHVVEHGQEHRYRSSPYQKHKDAFAIASLGILAHKHRLHEACIVDMIVQMAALA